MRVFITGASGMLGNNIVREFKKNGYQISAPERRELDLINPIDVRKHISDFKPDLVIHSAGLVGSISENIKRPYEFCFMNLQLGLNVINAAFSEKVPNLINISSANIYPEVVSDSGFVESEVISGSLNQDTEGYGLAKAVVTKLVEYLSAQYGVSYRSLIPCNLYGEWDSFDVNKAHMVPAIIRRLHEAKHANKDSVEIWGDGSARREFLYAADLASFIFNISGRVDSMPQNINIGAAIDYSVLEYNEIIAKVVGYNGKFHFNMDRPVGSKLKKLDLSLLKTTGWGAQTSIESGISNTYKYFLENEVK